MNQEESILKLLVTLLLRSNLTGTQISTVLGTIQEEKQRWLLVLWLRRMMGEKLDKPLESEEIWDKVELLEKGITDVPLFMKAAELVVTTGDGSTSMIQRKFGLYYDNCINLMNQLELYGIVGPSIEHKKRKVLINTIAELQELLSALQYLESVEEC